MSKRHRPPLPRLWLMTDERIGRALLPAIARLPRGSGIVFRHYALPPRERKALLQKVKRLARRYRHVVTVGGASHGGRPGVTTAPVHSLPQRIAAERAGARLLFVSPLFETRSHPGVRPLGRVRFGMIARNAMAPIIALGGMNKKRARSLRPFGIYGWAAIDGLLP